MNTIVIASAGTGKTTYLVDETAKLTDSRVLITTYTNENIANIRECLIKRFGCVPPHVSLASWYSVLLTHGVRPYQNLISRAPVPRATLLLDEIPPHALMVAKTAVDRRYFSQRGDIYRDRTSEFVCLLDDKTGGLVINRLAGIFTHVLVDELQDLNGYDQILLEKLFISPISVIAAGDPRQATYVTNRSTKNRAAARAGMVDWITRLEKQGVIQVENQTGTWRSNQVICDFADALYPDLPTTRSFNEINTGHDGIFRITADLVPEYIVAHKPVVLRYDKRANTLGLPAFNIGSIKGRTYDRVLVFPTKPMKAYLETKDIAVAGDRSKLYIAVTRARYSATFVVD